MMKEETNEINVGEMTKEEKENPKQMTKEKNKRSKAQMKTTPKNILDYIISHSECSSSSLLSSASCILEENYFKLKYGYNESIGNKIPEIQIGLDECARGCLFGRTYVGAVVWDMNFLQANAMNPEFAWIHQIRDSKKLTPSKRKMLSEKIKEYAKAWNVTHANNERIDTVNILYAVQMAFHEAIRKLCNQYEIIPDVLLVDGNYFVPFKREELIMESNDKREKEKENVEEIQSSSSFSFSSSFMSPMKKQKKINNSARSEETTNGSKDKYIQHRCIEKGDNMYLSIAAASIIAKVDHDEYIAKLCDRYPLLNHRYGIASNMGYGTMKHIEGIDTFGITNLHRRTFKSCDTDVTMFVFEDHDNENDNKSENEEMNDCENEDTNK